MHVLLIQELFENVYFCQEQKGVSPPGSNTAFPAV
jgi:hypothetical protein